MRLIFFLFSLSLFFSCQTNNNDSKAVKSDIVLLSEKINQNPNDINLILNRVDYNLNLKKYESALFDLNQCLSIDSLNSRCNFLAAFCYFEISKYDQTKSEYGKLALDCIKNSIEIDSDNFLAFSLYGEINIAYGRYKQAIDCFNKSLSKEYNQYKIHHLMGYAFKKLRQDDEAINCFQNSLNINPEYIEPYIELALVYQGMNDTLAETYYLNALKIDSSNVISLYNLALYYQSNFLYNKALETYNLLLAFDAFNANTHYNIGFIHMELDLHDVAVNNFADAIYSNPSFFESYYARGICFETLGNIAQAEVDYKRAIEINPEYNFAIDALENLNKNNLKYK